MSMYATIEKIANENGGFFLTRDAKKVNISRETLSRYVKTGKLERIRQGVYLLPEKYEDEMFSIQATIPCAVFSYDTALFLHDLSDRDPLRYTVTVPYGYNSLTLRKKNVRIRTDKRATHKDNVVEVTTMYGNKIRVYSIERTLCDCLKPRSGIDPNIIAGAFKQYAKSQRTDLYKLMTYAKSVGVDKKVRSYLEVLL